MTAGDGDVSFKQDLLGTLGLVVVVVAVITEQLFRSLILNFFPSLSVMERDCVSPVAMDALSSTNLPFKNS